MLFSYFAEGSFYLIKGLGLSPSQYGLSFILIAGATMMGGFLSKKLHAYNSSKDIMGYGLTIITVATIVFSIVAIVNQFMCLLPINLIILVTLLSQMSIAFGICMATSNALGLALVDYKYAIGTASSLFGFFYYCFICIFTYFMGLLHNGTFLPMPLYFLALSCLMLLSKIIFLKD